MQSLKSNKLILIFFWLALAHSTQAGGASPQPEENVQTSEVRYNMEDYKPSDEAETAPLAESNYRDFYSRVCLKYRDFLFGQLEMYPKLAEKFTDLALAHEKSFVDAVKATAEAKKACEYMQKYHKEFYQIFEAEKKSLKLDFLNSVQVNPGNIKCLTIDRMNRLAGLCRNLEMVKGVADYTLDFALGTGMRYVFFNGLPIDIIEGLGGKH